MKRSKSLVILILSVILVICAGVAVMFLIPDGKDNGDDKLIESLSRGQELFDEGDYKAAIRYFEKAIELDPDSESAYRSLGMSYYYLGEYDNARDAWTRGYDATGSDRFLTLIASYLDSRTGSEVTPAVADGKEAEIRQMKNDSGVSLNSILFEKFNEKKYSDYTNDYGRASFKQSYGDSIVTHSAFSGSFVYGETADGTSKLSPSGEPLDSAVPDSISVDDISMIIEGFSKSISYDELAGLGVLALKKDTDDELGNVVKFKYKNCIVTIACDENGSITSKDAENIIIPPQSSAQSGPTRHFMIDLVAASTGMHVDSSYTVTVAKEETVQSGDSMPLGTNDGIIYENNIVNGIIEIDLENTRYCVCIYPQDKPDEFKRYTWDVTDSTSDNDLKIVIADSLVSGQILIVLKWGDMPRDLDSHLVGEGDHICFYSKNGKNASLDVDCINGNGIETITLNDTAGDYTYYVHNYSHEEDMGLHSNATVEVFTADSTVPTVYTMPSNMKDVWEVFNIHNGKITSVDREGTLPN